MAYNTQLITASSQSGTAAAQTLTITGVAGKSIYLHQVIVSYGAAANTLGQVITVNDAGNPIDTFYAKDFVNRKYASPLRISTASNCTVVADAGEASVRSAITVQYQVE